MELKGIVHSVGQAVQVTDKFTKREFILKTEATSQYPQHIKIQTSGDKMALLDSIKAGNEVTVSVNVRGKLYTNKSGVEDCITNLQAWKIVVDSVSATPNTPGSTSQTEEDNDLPF